jgi:hypothetical protein
VAPGQAGLFSNQVIVGLVLLGLICVSVLGSTFWRLHVLKRDYKNSSVQAVKALKSQFGSGLGGIVLKDVVKNAKKQLEKDENFIAFMDPSRPTILDYLLDLTNSIDKQAVGLTIESLTIEGTTMNLKGKVKGFPELKIFERDLRQSKYFEFDRIDNYEFDLNIRLKVAEES